MKNFLLETNIYYSASGLHPSKSPLIKGRLRGDVKLNASRLMNSICLLIIIFLFSCTTNETVDLQTLIQKGEYLKSKELIKDQLIMDSTLTTEKQKELKFEIERMVRIEKDFTKTENEILKYIKKYIPDVTKTYLHNWETEKSLEFKMINGEKKYFKYAGRNLFRINKKCKKIWDDFHKKNNINLSTEKMDIDINNRAVMENCIKTGERYTIPVRMKIKYSLSVKPNIVPDGELIRCWIPFPRHIPERQINIKLLKTEPQKNILADAKILQRTVYLERKAVKDEAVTFYAEYEYTGYGSYVDIDPEKVIPVAQDSELKDFLKEQYPHIVFTSDLKKLSKEIIGTETNPYLKAKLIFKWIYDNIPWASAREYSTIRNISDYCIQNNHGDCGIKALTFVTLCRLNGIPARWQSGWEFKPPYNNMHDWTMVYFEPYGWVPADPDYSLRKTDDEKFKYFYLGGMDSYRLIFNDDISISFVPEKTHFRSETVDSQRGEVEWSGGNLYFDQWDWDMEFEVLSK